MRLYLRKSISLYIVPLQGKLRPPSQKPSHYRIRINHYAGHKSTCTDSNHEPLYRRRVFYHQATIAPSTYLKLPSLTITIGFFRFLLRTSRKKINTHRLRKKRKLIFPVHETRQRMNS